MTLFFFKFSDDADDSPDGLEFRDLRAAKAAARSALCDLAKSAPTVPFALEVKIREQPAATPVATISISIEQR